MHCLLPPLELCTRFGDPFCKARRASFSSRLNVSFPWMCLESLLALVGWLCQAPAVLAAKLPRAARRLQALREVCRVGRRARAVHPRPARPASLSERSADSASSLQEPFCQPCKQAASLLYLSVQNAD